MTRSNKLLLVVQSLELVEDLKESNITFLFPLLDFSIGFEHTFALEDIKTEHAYLFVNRLMSAKDIAKFKNLINNMPSNIEGIVFDDIGVLNILLESKSGLKKILFLNHLNCNYESINGWLEYVDSVIPSTDITESELDEILLHAKKPLTLFAFGHVNIMYSRRKLITNYNEHFKTNTSLNATLVEKQSQKKLKMMENDYGTVVYTNEPFNALEVINKEPALFYFINTVFLSNEEVKEIVNSTTNLIEKYPYTYLSKEETIYKLGGDM